MKHCGDIDKHWVLEDIIKLMRWCGGQRSHREHRAYLSQWLWRAISLR